MKRALWVIGVLLLIGAGRAGGDDAAGAPAPVAATGGGDANGAAPPARAGAQDEKIAEQLKAFCRRWMGFLAVRERDNRAAVKWQKDAAGVKGQFVGYSQDYDCTLKERGTGGVPVATIQYRELVYEQAGMTSDEARQQQANVIDATEVTEIFRYAKGEWVY